MQHLRKKGTSISGSTQKRSKVKHGGVALHKIADTANIGSRLTIMPKYAAPWISPPASPREGALSPAPIAGLALRPRLLLLHSERLSAQAIRHTLLPRCATVQIADTLNQVHTCLAQESWDVFLAHLAPEEKSGLESLRFAQGSGLLLARIALLDHMDPALLAASIPLDLDALLLPPLSAPLLRETVERCFVRVLQQRQEARTLAAMREQILTLKESRRQWLAEQETMESSVMEALLSTLAMREANCVLHALRVQAYASYFARLVNYPESLRPHLEHAALLHDIGKIGLSDALLFRSGVFTPAEVDRMQSHAAAGEQILHHIPFLRPAAQIVRHHHERFDGEGFPDGLRGEKIPLGARIFSIVDTLDAMTSDRPYRPAQTFEKAQQEMERCAGSHFDPYLTNVFLQVSPASWINLRRQVEERSAQHQPRLLGPQSLRSI